MGVLVYGSELSTEHKAVMKRQIDELRDAGKRIPCLAVILVGNNPASLSYVKGKEKACAVVGIESKMIHLEEGTTQDELNQVVEDCNEDPTIDGILIQLPLPGGLSEKEVLNVLSPEKDVDGLHLTNIGRLYTDEKGFVPCTPKGCMALLEKMGCNPDGKNAVVMGRSRLVGAPVARLLQDKNATVTITHTHTKDVKEYTKKADILIVAVGQPKMITSDYVKEGAYIIDVGINRTTDGHLVGDVDTNDVLPHCTAITPVPKGVGPMTICMLLENTIQAYFRREAK